MIPIYVNYTHTALHINILQLASVFVLSFFVNSRSILPEIIYYMLSVILRSAGEREREGGIIRDNWDPHGPKFYSKSKK